MAMVEERAALPILGQRVSFCYITIDGEHVPIEGDVRAATTVGFVVCSKSEKWAVANSAWPHRIVLACPTHR